MNITVFGPQAASAATSPPSPHNAATTSAPSTGQHRPPRPRPGRGRHRTSVFDPGFALLAVKGADAVVSAAGPNFTTRHMNRPGIDGDSEPTKGWSHVSTEEISG
jgi:hypothetical protein